VPLAAGILLANAAENASGVPSLLIMVGPLAMAVNVVLAFATRGYSESHDWTPIGRTIAQISGWFGIALLVIAVAILVLAILIAILIIAIILAAIGSNS
jgi:hypothetical protein